MQTSAQDSDRSLDEKLADLILLAFPMPRADPKRKMPLVGLYMTDPSHPVVRQLQMQFKLDNGIPSFSPMSDRERLLFDLSLVTVDVKREAYKLCRTRLRMEEETAE